MTITLCKACNKPFEHLSYIRRVYCSRICSFTNTLNKTFGIKNGRYKGKFSRLLSQSKRRAIQRNLIYNLTEEYLQKIWTGYCFISKIPIKLEYTHSLFQASLDRIDSSKGYIQGNVQFVALGINYAKNNSTLFEFKQFLNEIRKTV